MKVFSWFLTAALFFVVGYLVCWVGMPEERRTGPVTIDTGLGAMLEDASSGNWSLVSAGWASPADTGSGGVPSFAEAVSKTKDHPWFEFQWATPEEEILAIWEDQVWTFYTDSAR